MPTRNAPLEVLSDPLIARFRAACDTVGPVLAEQTVGVAVSGGGDSLALLLLATAAFPGRVRAATVDHGVRAESTREAAFVADLCTGLGIAHTTLHLLQPLPRGNVSARLRELRYAQLRRWQEDERIDWLMTGHHADDQLETVVMRLNRGAGIGGLAAIRARHGRTLRPLLGWRRDELAEIAANAGLVPIDDPSNHDDRYDRARLRKMLASADWLDPVAAARTAAAFDDADTALVWSAQHWFAERVTLGDALTFDPQGLPAELVRRILLACLTRINPRATPTGPKLTRLLAALARGQKATLDGVAFDARRRPWTIALAPPRKS